MADVNKVILIGRLGRDVEIRDAGNSQVANFSIATTERWKDKKSGEKQEKTEWHNIVAWGQTAELCDQYLKKGLSVYIEGKLQTRKWEDKNGTERYTTEIVVQNVQFIEFAEKDDDRSQDRGRGRDRDDRDDGRRDRGGRGEARASSREDRNDRSDRGSSERGGGKSGNQDDFDDDIPF